MSRIVILTGSPHSNGASQKLLMPLNGEPSPIISMYLDMMPDFKVKKNLTFYN